MQRAVTNAVRFRYCISKVIIMSKTSKKSKASGSRGSGKKAASGVLNLLDSIKFEYYLFLVRWMKRVDKVFSVSSGYTGVFKKQFSLGNLRMLIGRRPLSGYAFNRGVSTVGAACIVFMITVFVLGTAYFDRGLASDRLMLREEALFKSTYGQAAFSETAIDAGGADIGMDFTDSGAFSTAAALEAGNAGSADGNAGASDSSALSAAAVSTTRGTATSAFPLQANFLVFPAAIPEAGDSAEASQYAVADPSLFTVADAAAGADADADTDADTHADADADAGADTHAVRETAVKQQSRATKLTVNNIPLSTALRAEAQIDWDGDLIWPADGPVSSWYGYRTATIGSTNHKGIDISGSRNNEIYAASAGEVIFSGYDGKFGKVIRIMHEPGVVTLYAHCNSLYANAGDMVSRGQVIAGMGMTGSASGVHLHFEVIINGTNVNPVRYLP